MQSVKDYYPQNMPMHYSHKSLYLLGLVIAVFESGCSKMNTLKYGNGAGTSIKGGRETGKKIS